jgi:recombination protein RecA
VVKNKVSPPFKLAEFEILYGHGISVEGEIIDLGVQNDLIQKSGSWYSYQGERIGQGKDKARNFLLENESISNELRDNIRKIMLPDSEDAEHDEESEDD